MIDSHRTRRRASVLAALLLLGLVPVVTNTPAAAKTGTPSPVVRTGRPTPPPKGIGTNLPLVFEQNVGQTDPSVSFIAHGSGYTAFFTPTSAVLTLRAPGSKTQNLQQLLAPPSTKDAAVSIDSEGANASAVATGEDKLPSVANYFIGNESGQWHARVATYSKIRFANVYPGIDVEYYGTQQGLEYDYIVAPGADPSVIRVGYRGVTSLAKSMDGSVVLHTAVGNLAERAPTTYQDSGTGRRSVSSSFA